METLFTFYNNEVEREAVRAFLMENLRELAVIRAFSGKEVTGIAEAKTVIDAAFSRLEEKFKPKKITKKTIR